MKRIIGLMAVFAMAIALSAPMAAIAAPDNGGGASGSSGADPGSLVASERQICFVDADEDGICDNFQNGQCGQCRGRHMLGQNANGSSACPGFVDEDSDGICDNCEQRHSANRHGYGLGAGNGTGQGSGLGAGGKGKCYGLGSGSGMGQGNGLGAGRGMGHGNGYVDAYGDGVCDNRQ